MSVLLDSSFVVDLLRGVATARRTAEEIDATGELVALPAPVLYEIRVGLLHRLSAAQAARFAAMLTAFPVIALDKASAEKAAEIQARGLAAGKPYGDLDALIGGIAAAQGYALLTRDRELRRMGKEHGIEVREYA